MALLLLLMKVAVWPPSSWAMLLRLWVGLAWGWGQ